MERIGTRYEECRYCDRITEIPVYEGDNRSDQFEPGEVCATCKLLEEAAEEEQFEKEMIAVGNFIRCEYCLKVFVAQNKTNDEGLCDECNQAFMQERGE